MRMTNPLIARGQESPMHEFTATEIFEALRRVAPEREAWLAAEDATALVDMEAIRSSPSARPSGQGLAYVPVPTMNFTEDMLVLLSLVSDETAAKVERYRELLRGGAALTEEEARAWTTRRAELTEWRDSGYPREEDASAE